MKRNSILWPSVSVKKWQYRSNWEATKFSNRAPIEGITLQSHKYNFCSFFTDLILGAPKGEIRNE